MTRTLIGLLLLLAVACGGNSGTRDAGPVEDMILTDAAPDPGLDPGVVQDAPAAPDPGTNADVPCVPNCTGRRCGDDGCGGSCGTCPYPDAHLECVDGKCLPPMIDIPAGTFWMGCNEAVDGECAADEKPYHPVTLSAYRIDKYEVTAGAYKEYLAAMGPDCKNPGDGTGCWTLIGFDWLSVNNPGKAIYPADSINWYQADGYCQWAGRSLCTEAQWEFAARGDNGRKFPWGSDCPESWGNKCIGPEWTEVTAKANCINDHCHDGFAETADNGTSPVGSFPSGASPFGVLDMAGNVVEWVKDVYGADYYCNGPMAVTAKDSPCPAGSAPYDDPWNDPAGPDVGPKRILRGGSWMSFHSLGFYFYLRAGQRKGWPPIGNGAIFFGFRCCQGSPSPASASFSD